MLSPPRLLHLSKGSFHNPKVSRRAPFEDSAFSNDCFQVVRILNAICALTSQLCSLCSYICLIFCSAFLPLHSCTLATTASLSLLPNFCDTSSARLASGRTSGHTSGRTPQHFSSGGSTSSWGSGPSRSLRGSVSSYPLPSSSLREIPTTISSSSGDARTYHLEVVQQPETTAEFGAAALSRLPIAPPLFVQLIIRDFRGNVIENEPDLPFFIAHLSLYSGDGRTLLDERRGSGAFPPDRLLYGNIVSSPHSLRNLHGSPGIYFLFPDVSVRYRGLYTLRISLMRLSRYDRLPLEQGR
ncbi:uncharacterized protein STEHIDRAFT_126028 [Stereum hirsutum FP-91666 SS1]|uniref:Velvet domain-containing protein n=1 Tax=Stereum hirsutum (strain FP-91666) TaxID=721885 RepID=R7S1Q2_STEHR|nr:uncharacterized protein STEHIDRAFT_126028 [Stereum hirsutum FP-91666 SS1]EIM80502.1 hypothetical protein STEHIDRAFT_126028 [Stereum hirsutum FP-91666 SS1]